MMGSSSAPKQVTATAAAAAPAAKNPGGRGRGGGGGVDKLLQKLSKDNKVSTAAKTSADWDQFKDASGLGNKIEEHAESKDAYLKRQDFLQRVDHRKFELERQGREKERFKQQHR